MSELSVEMSQEVIRPKVQGSLHLDHLFKEDDLDFFIFFSSISSILGIPGQSAYAAANLFMTSLAEQRKRRGLAATVINIGAVLGAGYITQTGMDTTKTRTAYGFISLSVSDFHQMFAEAVHAGKNGDVVEIAAGIMQFGRHELLQPRWASNLIMTHFILNTEGHKESLGGATMEVPLKVQLSEALTLNEVHEITQAALIKALGMLLQLDASLMASLRPVTRLDEIGIDSILALEIRAWLMDNLSFNYPVLQILSGISIEELVSAAVDGIDDSLIPKVAEQTTTSSEHGNVDSSKFTTSGVVAFGSQSISSRSDMEDPQLNASMPASPIMQDENYGEDSSIRAILPSFPSQTMFWSALTLFEDKTSLNFSALCSIDGQLDVPQMEIAVRDLGQQHEALRTRFLYRDGVLNQTILKESPLKLEHEHATDRNLIEKKMNQVRRHKYNAEQGELVKLVIVSKSPLKHFLLFGASHLCMDGISVRIFITDLFRHYHRQPQQATIQFRDYGQAHQALLESGGLNSQFQFWKTQYPDFPPPLPILRVSRVTLRPALSSFKSAAIETSVSLDMKQQIAAVCRQCRVTPFHFYLTVFRVLLSRLSDVSDVSIGIVDAGRDEKNRSSIGVYSNLLPLRFRSDASNKFEDLLQETRRITLAALGNSQLPFQSLIERYIFIWLYYIPLIFLANTLKIETAKIRFIDSNISMSFKLPSRATKSGNMGWIRC
jgi:hybrid polyketide synthase/nonribosomal peptide synthetase ACE1